jgi:DNA invertase Pin-like site-specific DNA recombinase
MSDYVAYYRVSTDGQGESGLGLDAQRQAVATYVREGQLAAEFTEVESGKRHTNRPQLAAALTECRRRRAVLVIATLDRLARNVHFVSGLMESGVPFVAVDRPQADSFRLHIEAAINEEEARKISLRTKAALQQIKARLAEDGQRVSRRGRVYTKLGNPRWHEGSLARATAARNPIKPAPQLIEIMQRHRADGDSLRQIAGRLNTLGLYTPKGKPWHASTVRTQLERHK